MKDRVVLVTGGAGHLGRYVTRAFLASGARVAVPLYTSDSPDSLASAAAEFGDRLHTVALDLTTERGAEAAVSDAVEWGGALHSVVHLVGGYAGGTPLAETPLELWERMLDLNLKSAFLVMRSAVPAVVRSGGGSFVFVSSRAALGDRAGHGAYAVAKSALITLARTLAEEYGAEGVRANVVVPGTIDTEQNRQAMPAADRSGWVRPEEIAEVIRFLASPAAAGVSGALLPVNGSS